MNKSELAESLATRVGLTKAQAAATVSAIFDGGDGLIVSSLKSGGEVALQGFGTFKVASRAARTATNPATGGKIQVAAKKVAKFKPGKNLVESIA